MTSKQNRGGPVSPSHPPRLHRNTRAMRTLQTHSSPLSSATLHYPCSTRHTEAQNHFLHTAAVRQLTAKLLGHSLFACTVHSTVGLQQNCPDVFHLSLCLLIGGLDISGYCRAAVMMTQGLDCGCTCEDSNLAVSTASYSTLYSERLQ